jgi:hypothetical protein
MRERTFTVLAGIRAGGINLHRLPKRLFKALSGCDESGISRCVHLPLRGQRRLGRPVLGVSLLLPVELRRVNHTASTNTQILRAIRAIPRLNPTM